MLELMILIFIISIYRNDLKTIKKEDLAVPLKERIFTQVIALPIWAIDILLIIAIINPALLTK